MTCVKRLWYVLSCLLDLAQSIEHLPEVIWFQDQTSSADVALGFFFLFQPVPMTGVKRMWYVLSCLRIIHIKDPLMLIKNRGPQSGGSRFLVLLYV